MTGPHGIDPDAQREYEEDADAVVGRFLDAEQEHRAAQQRDAKARDVVAEIHYPVRLVDRGAEAAQARLDRIETAEALARERVDAVEALRTSVLNTTKDRDLARGRGPAARAAAARMQAASYERLAHRDRIADLDDRLAAATEAVGSPDPEAWAAMRAQDEETLISYRDRRQAAIDESSVRYPAALAGAQATQAGVQAATDQLDAATDELRRRGIDADRIIAAADRIRQEGHRPDPDAVSREELSYQQRARELDAERGIDRDRC